MSQGPKQRKMGRYTEHIRSGTQASGEWPSGPHSLRDHLNENSQEINQETRNKGSKTKLPQFQMRIREEAYNTQRVMNEYSSGGLEDAARSEDTEWAMQQ